MHASDHSHAQVLHFYLQETIACIDLKYLEQTVLLPSLEPIPESPMEVMGFMNVGGKSILVIDLVLCLHIPRKTLYTTETPILLCTHNHETCGFIVDKTLDLQSTQDNDYQVIDHWHEKNKHFSGTVSYNNRLSFLLNVKQLMRSIVKTANQLKQSSLMQTPEVTR
jgi:chemotaxis signal transduction protein